MRYFSRYATVGDHKTAIRQRQFIVSFLSSDTVCKELAIMPRKLMPDVIRRYFEKL
jgi:hypothetical protein